MKTSPIDLTDELIDESLELISEREISINYDFCLGFSDGEITFIDEITKACPNGARFYRRGKAIPNRPIGLGLPDQPPLIFNLKVKYFR